MPIFGFPIQPLLTSCSPPSGVSDNGSHGCSARAPEGAQGPVPRPPERSVPDGSGCFLRRAFTQTTNHYREETPLPRASFFNFFITVQNGTEHSRSMPRGSFTRSPRRDSHGVRTKTEQIRVKHPQIGVVLYSYFLKGGEPQNLSTLWGSFFHYLYLSWAY